MLEIPEERKIRKAENSEIKGITKQEVLGHGREAEWYFEIDEITICTQV